MTTIPNAQDAPSLPRFIVDEPADLDTLETHGRVADAIAEVIRRPSKIRMIGLLGRWGSGKSTVIRLLEHELRRGPGGDPILCFNYDTWLRQNELPRRAFLQGLIGFLDDQDLPQIAAKRKEWSAKLLELAGASETTTTSTSIELSLAGRFILPTLLFMPLGWKLIGDGVLYIDATTPAANYWLFSLGWFLSIAPIVMALGLMKFAKLKPRDILAVFTNKPPEVKVEAKARNPEPSAIEFQDMFQDIVQSVRGSGHRLLMVIDNLDRLPPAEALTLWATLRSFFLDARHGIASTKLRDLPMVIVPLDPGAPARIHGDSGDVEDDEGGLLLNRSFVEKTFDIVFHVPQPVLSKWQEYLRRQLRNGFGEEISEHDLFAVTAIYDAFRQRWPKRILTAPRSLNSFVNALAVLWLQWREASISFAAMAFFVCHRDEIANNIQTALQTEIGGIEGHDHDWRTSVAALHYGVGKAQAVELFMGGPIRDALSGENVKELRRLAPIPGFESYLDQVLVALNPDSVAPAARTLEASAFENMPWVREAWRTMRRVALIQLQSRGIRPADDRALLALVNSLSESERATYISELAQTWSRLNPETFAQEGVSHCAAALLALAGAARAAGLQDFRILIPPNVDLYLAILEIGGSAENLAAIDAKQSADNVVGRLASLLATEEGARHAGRAAAAYAHVAPPETEWFQLLEIVTNLVERGDPNILAPALKMVVDIAETAPQALQRISQWRDEGLLVPMWSRLPVGLADEELAPPLAMMLAAPLHVRPNDGSTWATTLEHRPNLVFVLLNSLCKLAPDLGLRWLKDRHQENPGLSEVYELVARTLVADREEEFATPDLLDDLGGYFDLLRSGPVIGFWMHLAKVAGFWEALHELSLSDSTKIYVALTAAAGSKAPLGRHVKAKLKEVTFDTWVAALQGGGDPYALLTALRALDRTTLKLDAPLAAALAQALDDMVFSTDGALRARWFDLAKWVAAEPRRLLLHRVAELLVSQEPPNPIDLLDLGGRDLIGDSGLNAMADEATGSLLRRLLADPDAGPWLSRNVDVATAWLRGSRPETQASMRGTLGLGHPNTRNAAENILERWDRYQNLSQP